MVHALEYAHRMLRPDGALINVHDLPVPHLIEIHSPEAATKAGWLTDRTDFADERSALNALAQVVDDGHFTLEDERDFDFNIHADDWNELREWLAESWESAVLSERTIQRVEEVIREAGQPARVVLIVPARMTKLRAA